MNDTPRIVVMISGSGTNLQALIDAIKARHLHAQIALVVSNRKAAYGLTRAQEAGIETLYLPLKPYKDAGRPREDYDRDLAEKIAAYQPTLIVLAGWMHIMSPAFIDRFPDHTIINLHPALPGQYPGVNAIERQFEAYHHGQIDYGGCMVHYVTPEVDVGEVIAAAEVPIHPRDTLESFERNMHGAEHQIIVQAVVVALRRVDSSASPEQS